jgi:uncharacterized repeat protein (TIGR03847 family)
VNENDLSPEVFTADYSGRPGHRAFYLQARGGESHRTFAIEKEQVAALAEKLREMLVAIDRSDSVLAASAARDPALAGEPPLEPEWRVGAMGLAYDEGGDEILVVVQPADEEEEAEATLSESRSLRLRLRRDQIRAFVLHALAVVGEGRPPCPLCTLPMDPEGHRCPATNGHFAE